MAIPSTRTRTDHAMAIIAGGKTIGHIQDWTPQQSRTVTPVYELDPSHTGEVVENVPGNIGGLTIGVNRYDLFTKRMEEIWGIGSPTQAMVMLTDQRFRIEVRESWKTITNEVSGATIDEVWLYTGVWFTSLGRTHSANGDRITKVNAAFAYEKKIKQQ